MYGANKMGQQSAEDGEEQRRTEAEVSALSNLDDLMEEVGTTGRWNIMVILLCSFVAFVAPFQNISYQLLGATPDYWCEVEPLISANWTQENILIAAIPLKNNSDEHESCKMYDYDYKNLTALTYNLESQGDQADFNILPEDVRQKEPKSCTKRVFNLTQYSSTVVTKWDLVCDSRYLYSMTQAVSQLGVFVGSLVFGYSLDIFGRRKVILIGTTGTCIAGFITAVSPTLEFYIIMRLMVGAMGMGAYVGSFVLAMELATTKQRSHVGMIYVLPWALGYMILPGIAYFIRDWQWLQAALTLPALGLIAFFWFLPESPRWLILEGRHSEALKVLQNAARVNGRTLSSETSLLQAMENIKQANEKNKDVEEEKPAMKERIMLRVFGLLMVPWLRARTLIVNFCWFSVSLVYYGVSLNSDNLSANTYVYIFLGGLTEVPAYLLMWPMIIYLGRKKTIFVLYLLAGISIGFVTILIYGVPTTPGWIKIILSLIGKMAVTGAFHLIYIYTAELFPTNYRSLAVGQASVCARCGSILSPFINDLLGEISPFSPSLLFCILSFIASGLCLMLPETNNKEMVENEDKSIENEQPMQETNGETNHAYLKDQKDQ